MDLKFLSESQSPPSNTRLIYGKELTVFQDNSLTLVLCAQVLGVLGIAESSRKMFIYHAVNVPLEIGEHHALRSPFCFHRLFAFTQLWGELPCFFHF